MLLPSPAQIHFQDACTPCHIPQNTPQLQGSSSGNQAADGLKMRSAEAGPDIATCVSCSLNPSMLSQDHAAQLQPHSHSSSSPSSSQHNDKTIYSIHSWSLRVVCKGQGTEKQVRPIPLRALVISCIPDTYLEWRKALPGMGQRATSTTHCCSQLKNRHVLGLPGKESIIKMVSQWRQSAFSSP